MTENAYIEALSKIPKGETRTYGEIARLAGRPSGARAAGRAVSACPSDARTPWHRAVTADGALSVDPERAALQLERLRKEGARPKEGEKVARWAKRVKCEFVADWRGRRFAPLDHERIETFDPERVERIASAADAKARGFTPIDAPRTRAARESKAAAAPRPTQEESRALRPAPLPNFVSDAIGAVRDGLDEVNWKSAVVSLRQMGAFVAPDVVSPETCTSLRAMWDDDERFERTIEMEPRGYGIGTYRYWREPLPEPAEEIRTRVYTELRALAAEHPHAPEFPPKHVHFLARGHDAGQMRASCILLRYPKGGVNHPHRDIYGPVWFPYQALFVLSERGGEFRGGEFALYDKGPDGARVERTFPLDQGDLCLFASRSCLRTVAHRERWVEVEHGMTPVTQGVRFAFGIVLHPAQ